MGKAEQSGEEGKGDEKRGKRVWREAMGQPKDVRDRSLVWEKDA